MKVPPFFLRWYSKTANIYLNLRKSLYTKGKRRGRCCPNTYLNIYLNTYLDTYLDTYLANQAIFTGTAL